MISSNTCLVSRVECFGRAFYIKSEKVSGDVWNNCPCNLFNWTHVKQMSFGKRRGKNKCLLPARSSLMLNRSTGFPFFMAPLTNVFVTIHDIHELAAIASTSKIDGTISLTASISTGICWTCLGVPSGRMIVPRDSYTVSAKRMEFMEHSSIYVLTANVLEQVWQLKLTKDWACSIDINIEFKWKLHFEAIPCRISQSWFAVHIVCRWPHQFFLAT